MALNEKVAFIIILIAAGGVGVAVYYIFADAAPQPNVMNSVYRKDLPPPKTEDVATAGSSAASKDGGGEGGSKAPVAASATLTILAGSSTQGNPDYDPDNITIKKGESINVDNKDTMPHTVTNGKSPSDADSAKLFDTGIINGGESAVADTSALDAGEYAYYCIVHPYMTGTVTVQ